MKIYKKRAKDKENIGVCEVLGSYTYNNLASELHTNIM